MNAEEKRRKAAALGHEIDKLREEWDRLDPEGSQSTMQNHISKQIGQLKAEYLEVTGEDYDFSKKADISGA